MTALIVVFIILAFIVALVALISSTFEESKVSKYIENRNLSSNSVMGIKNFGIQKFEGGTSQIDVGSKIRASVIYCREIAYQIGDCELVMNSQSASDLTGDIVPSAGYGNEYFVGRMHGMNIVVNDGVSPDACFVRPIGRKCNGCGIKIKGKFCQKCGSKHD